MDVRDVENIPPSPAGADQRRWRVAVDDGTIPASIEVYMSASEANAMATSTGDEVEWIRQEVQRTVSSAPDAGAAVQELRLLDPLELRWPG